MRVLPVGEGLFYTCKVVRTRFSGPSTTISTPSFVKWGYPFFLIPGGNVGNITYTAPVKPPPLFPLPLPPSGCQFLHPLHQGLPKTTTNSGQGPDHRRCAHRLLPLRLLGHIIIDRIRSLRYSRINRRTLRRDVWTLLFRACASALVLDTVSCGFFFLMYKAKNRGYSSPVSFSSMQSST